MSSQRNCDVNDAAAMRAVYPRHTMKRLAVAMNVPLDTARHWLFRKMSDGRRRELALMLLKEMDEQEVERTAVRYRLAQWAAGGNDLEVVGISDRVDITQTFVETVAARVPKRRRRA